MHFHWTSCSDESVEWLWYCSWNSQTNASNNWGKIERITLGKTFSVSSKGKGSWNNRLKIKEEIFSLSAHSTSCKKYSVGKKSKSSLCLVTKNKKKHTVTFPDWNMFFLKIKTSVCIFYFCTIENLSLLKCLFVCLSLNQMIKLNHVLYRLPTPYSTWMLWTHLLLLKWLFWSWGPRIVVTNSNDIVLNYKVM